MRSSKDRSTPDVAPMSSPAANAFDGAFLARLEEQEEPPTAAEAELAGPWRIESLPPSAGGGFGLFRAGESLSRGYRPAGRFDALWLAQLVAALLPALGRDEAYRLRSEEGEQGYALESREAWGAVVGYFELYDPDVVAALNAVDGLMRSPSALSLLLEACGKTTLEKAGAVLDARTAAAR